MSDARELAKEAGRAAARAATSAMLSGDDATKAKRKRWLALAGIGVGGLGLLLLWSVASKIGFYLLILLFGAGVAGGSYYLAKGKWQDWQRARLTAKVEDSPQIAEVAKVDERARLEAELHAQLEELKRKAR